MKYTLVISLSLILFLTACGPTQQDAIKYNNAISQEQKAVSEQIDSVFYALNSYDTVLIDRQIEQAKKQVVLSKSALEKQGDFFGDKLLYDPALNVLNTFEDHLTHKFSRIHQLYCIPDSLYSEENRQEAEKISKTVITEREKVLTDLKKAQQEFAQKYEFTFETDSVSNK